MPEFQKKFIAQNTSLTNTLLNLSGVLVKIILVLTIYVRGDLKALCFAGFGCEGES